jgi:hypothetical protein
MYGSLSGVMNDCSAQNGADMEPRRTMPDVCGDVPTVLAPTVLALTVLVPTVLAPTVPHDPVGSLRKPQK